MSDDILARDRARQRARREAEKAKRKAAELAGRLPDPPQRTTLGTSSAQFGGGEFSTESGRTDFTEQRSNVETGRSGLVSGDGKKRRR